MAAISGVAFSLTMVLLQLGFLEAVKITASNNFDQLDFDVVLISPRYEQFYAPGVFPLERLTEARSVPTVVAAALRVRNVQSVAMPALPPDEPERERRSASRRRARSRVAAGRAASPAAPAPRAVRHRHRPGQEPVSRSRSGPGSRRPRPCFACRHRVLLNEQSHPDFGWQLRDQFNGWELGNHAVTLVGGFPMLRGFAADSTVICDDRNFARLCGFPRESRQLRFPEGPARARSTRPSGPEGALPADVEVFSRARDPEPRDRPLGEPDLDRPALRVRRAGGDDRGDGGGLPGPLQRRARAPGRVCHAQGHGLLAGKALAGGRRAVAHLHDDRLRSCRGPGDRGLLGNPGTGRHSHATDVRATC